MLSEPRAFQWVTWFYYRVAFNGKFTHESEWLLWFGRKSLNVEWLCSCCGLKGPGGETDPPHKSFFWDFPEPGNFPGWGSLLVTQELSSFFECHGHYLSWERNILSQQCSRIACEMIAPGITNTITLHHLNTCETLTHRILYPSGGHLCQPKRRSEGLYPSSHHNKHKNSCLP